MKIIPPQDADFLLSSYCFELPEERIAQQPEPERDASRLMVLERDFGAIRAGVFSDILRFLPENCLLVANNSRVVPARMFGFRPGGGRAEALLLTPLPLLEPRPDPAAKDRFLAEAEALLRPAKKIRPGGRIRVSDDLELELVTPGEFGRCRVLLRWRGDLYALLQQHGVMPLPPYIRRPRPGAPAREGEHAAKEPGAGKKGGQHPESVAMEEAREARRDQARYQTVYARSDKAGSVAAPTAGLHFTPALRKALAASGREWAEVTLYVGYGTFSPVRGADIRTHAMHAEYVEVPAATAEAVTRARREGRPIIAVGTTSARTLEGVYAVTPGDKNAPFLFAPHAGWINIFLYPGKPFQVIDGLITNFHLPESSLLMLVAALAGRERVLAAYKQAIEQGFRFFSYGDAMLIV